MIMSEQLIPRFYKATNSIEGNLPNLCPALKQVDNFRGCSASPGRPDEWGNKTSRPDDRDVIRLVTTHLLKVLREHIFLLRLFHYPLL